MTSSNTQKRQNWVKYIFSALLLMENDITDKHKSETILPKISLKMTKKRYLRMFVTSSFAKKRRYIPKNDAGGVHRAH